MTSRTSFLAATLRRFETDREYQFWVLQMIGWGGLCVITFLSLTVWYGTPNWRHVSHTLIQAALGIALTLPLRTFYRKMWNQSLFRQFVTVAIVVTIVSVVWTALRMQTFLWLGEEYDIWKDFGGWYFGSFMVFSSWTALYFGVKFYLLLQKEQLRRAMAYQDVQEEQLKRLSAETGLREAQIEMLRYQLNPHFLFNTLNSISALVKTKRSEQARNMIAQLGDFLRFSLDNDGNQKVTLARELEILNLYLDIEKVRYGDRLNIEVDVDQEVSDAVIPSLILQPLLENALKFAVAGRVKGGTIQIRARIDETDLIMTVDDDGPGLKESAYTRLNRLELENKIGLKNVAERLTSHYGAEATLAFSPSVLGGFSATIKFPFIKSNGKHSVSSMLVGAK